MIEDGPDGGCPLRASNGGKIDVRIAHALADPLIFDGALARACDAFLMDLVVVERTIVGDD